ncbi:MAG: sigma-70 family RNA polymerase sigma factor [Solirubrobacterales bacterium]
MSEGATAAGFSRLLSDDRLTRRAVGGDKRAFAAIFSRYHQALYRFCLAIVGNPDDAQEALQNTMAKVLRALPGEERAIELKPWLYRIAHNESIDLLRRRRETRELDVEQVAPGYGLAEDVATRERLRGLLDDLRELPERQREVLVMRELSGLDFEEIGAALDTTGAVARQTLYEARQSLRQMDAGREMSCDEVARALSDGDGRVTRRRDIRAHLRSCTACRQFRDEIEGRQRDLAALAPLPPAAAVGMLHGLLGGGSQGATGGGLAATLGGGAAKTIGASAVAKGVATVAVVAAIGVTAADRSGTIHLGLPGDRSSRSSSSSANSPDSGDRNSSAADRGGKTSAANGSQAGGSAQAGARGANNASGKGKEKGHANGHRGHRHDKAAAPASPTEHPHGRNHEKQHPTAAAKGQETAAAHAPAQRGGGGNGGGNGGGKGGGGEQAPSSNSSKAPSSPPKGSGKPPAAASEASHPPAPSGSAEAVAPSAETSGPGNGKGAEKKP